MQATQAPPGALWSPFRREGLGLPAATGPLRNSVAACRTAHKRWPKAAITLQQGMGSSEDSGGARIDPRLAVGPG